MDGSSDGSAGVGGGVPGRVAGEDVSARRAARARQLLAVVTRGG